MSASNITLTEDDGVILHDLARQTGKAEGDLVHEALHLLREEVYPRREARLEKLRQARGMWKERDDLPTARELREEWERRMLDHEAETQHK